MPASNINRSHENFPQTGARHSDAAQDVPNPPRGIGVPRSFREQVRQKQGAFQGHGKFREEEFPADERSFSVTSA